MHPGGEKSQAQQKPRQQGLAVDILRQAFYGFHQSLLCNPQHPHGAGAGGPGFEEATTLEQLATTLYATAP